MPLVRVGWAVGPHGVKGALKFTYTTDHPEWIQTRASYLLSDPRSKEVLELTPVDVKTRGTDFTIKFAEYDAPEPLVELKAGTSATPRSAVSCHARTPTTSTNRAARMQLRRPDGSVIATVAHVRDSGVHTLLELDLPASHWCRSSACMCRK